VGKGRGKEEGEKKARTDDGLYVSNHRLKTIPIRNPPGSKRGKKRKENGGATPTGSDFSNSRESSIIMIHSLHWRRYKVSWRRRKKGERRKEGENHPSYRAFYISGSSRTIWTKAPPAFPLKHNRIDNHRGKKKRGRKEGKRLGMRRAAQSWSAHWRLVCIVASATSWPREKKKKRKKQVTQCSLLLNRQRPEVRAEGEKKGERGGSSSLLISR